MQTLGCEADASVAMKTVHSSVNLVSIKRALFKISEKLPSCQQFKYLLVVPFLVVVAVGSYKVGNSSGTVERNTGDEDWIRQKREVDAVRNENEKYGSYGGAVYIRWGRTQCATGSETVYRGIAGGSLFEHPGGGSNYLCLPLQPIWGAYNEGVEKHSKLYGSEYELPSGFGLNNNHNRPLQDNNVPCVVCRSRTKTSILMIPARNQCYSGWYTEYTGYLMAERDVHKGRTEFVCVDGQPESDPAGFRDENGALFYNVEGVCGSLPCPPYAPRREITCAVCSK